MWKQVGAAVALAVVAGCGDDSSAGGLVPDGAERISYEDVPGDLQAVEGDDPSAEWWRVESDAGPAFLVVSGGTGLALAETCEVIDSIDWAAVVTTYCLP